MDVWPCTDSSGIGWRSGQSGRTADPILHDWIKRIGRRPRFIHPAQALQREGVVFTTTSADGKDRLWLLTTYDPGNGRVEYVIMAPVFTANEIKIRVTPDGKQHSKATITYRRSALAPEGNGEVAKLDAHWAEQQRIHWETAINEVLTKGGVHD